MNEVNTWKVYVLKSGAIGKIYVGMTSNLTRRLEQHNFGDNKQAFTWRGRPWELIYSETCDSKKSARIRELELKSGQGRKWIKENLLK